MKMSPVRISHHGRAVYAVFYEPNRAGTFPVVIFSHGFNGSGGDFIGYVRLLEEKGVAALIFDFCGGSVTYSGSMKSTDMTLFTELEDLEAVIGYAAMLGCVDRDKIFLFGASQGGVVTALAASRHSGIPAGIILLYPALCIPDDWERMFPDASEIPDTVKRWGVTLGRKYFEAVRGFRIYEEIGGYHGPVLVMHGEDDTVVSVDYSRRLSGVYRNICIKVFAGEGHGFTQAGDAKAAGFTLDFIKKVTAQSQGNAGGTD